jgi:glycosyltransferase involved in cell wall biosynthesis
MEEPLVSIICDCYNHEKYINDALDGFIMQKTNFAFEVLIHDDASTDKSKDIIEKYAKKYPNIVFPIYQEVNQYSQGISIWKNYQFSRAKGKYIALCEGDDYWTDPYKLQKQVDFLEANEDYAICFHEIMVQKDDELVENYITKVPKNTTTLDDISRGNYIQTCSTVLRKDFVDFPDWFSSKLNAGDYPLYLLLSRFGKIYFINEKMCVYRVHAGGIYSSADVEKLLVGNIHLLKVLISNFKLPIVKQNLRLQLKSTLNNLYFIYIVKRKFAKAVLIKIKYILVSMSDNSALHMMKFYVSNFIKRNTVRIHRLTS